MDAPFGPCPWREDINSGPDLCWGPALQVIMRTIMVVPATDVPQGAGEITLVCNRLRRQRPLDGSDEPLDSSVLPGASRFGPLVTDSEQVQPPDKPDGYEDRFIIRPQELWSTIPLHQLDQLLEQPPRRFVRKGLQPQTGAARMIHNRQREMGLPTLIRLRQ